jgi:HD-like signal output (HDOD) protein/CheY-like chemotaxis protein
VIRILFVDDDVNLLEAMRLTMRPMRDKWSMEFASSGEEALESLAKCPADVVVSDMRMPRMDGWQLLTQVKELYPQTVRLVLSGHADPGAIMRLVGTAHQYIEKPAQSAVLAAAIAQTQLLKGLLGSDSLAALVGGIGTLPSIPKAFQEISICLQRPKASLADAARIIGRDVAMTANIMKLVNSAFFASRRPVSSVDRAIAHLGLDTLCALVLGHGLFHSASSVSDGISLEALWQHSLKTAMAARAIALHEGLPAPRIEEAFLTGILHDVGRVVFATRKVSMTGDPAISAESVAAQIEERHAQVGAYLLALWGFPSHIVAAVALHHRPSERADSGFDLTALIHIADRLAHAQADISPGVGPLGIEPQLLGSLGLDHHLPKWMAALDLADAGHAH